MINDPRLECSSCARDYVEFKQKPLCLTARGCPIQHLAENSEYTRICYAFVKAKRLEKLGYTERKLEILKDSGINDDDQILELESVWIDFELWQKQKAKLYK